MSIIMMIAQQLSILKMVGNINNKKLMKTEGKTKDDEAFKIIVDLLY